VVDDLDETQADGQHHSQDRGWTTTFASDGKEALAAMKREVPDMC